MEGRRDRREHPAMAERMVTEGKVTGMIREYIIKVDDKKTDIMGGIPLEEPPKELIRCKDCWKRREWFCELDGKYHSPNFFCGFGKPKDGDGE